MTWQKIIGHVTDSSIVVESKSGNQYPVTPENRWIGEEVYSILNNISATEHKRDKPMYLWGWINFSEENGPVLEYTVRSSEYPDKPPWET